MKNKKLVFALMLALCLTLSCMTFARPFAPVSFAETEEQAVLFAAEEAAAETDPATDPATAPATESATESAAAPEQEEAGAGGFTEKAALKFKALFKDGVGGEIVAFLASMLPIIECRGGMIIAKSFRINFFKAFLLCYIGNMIPIPFILLLIKQIFAFMKKHHILTKFIEKLEGKTDKNREKVLRYKQWGLLAFIAVPLPGTGGWTGSLFAALLDIDFKKALPIVALGVFIADVIMSVLTYGVGAVFGF